MDVFLSYRRADSEGHTGRLYDSLGWNFSRKTTESGSGKAAPKPSSFKPFMDVDNIGFGEDFQGVIGERLATCDAVLCVIGPHWLDAAEADGRRRLDLEGDPVRLEIETAMERGIPIIPVLVGGAKMPPLPALPESIRGLGTLNASQLSHKRWDDDVDKLKVAIKVEAERGRKRGVSKLGRKAPRLSGREIVTKWLTGARPPTLVGRNGGLDGKLFKSDVDSGDWKTRPYDVSFESVPPPNKNWLTVEDFVERIIPTVNKEPTTPVVTEDPLTGQEIYNRFLEGGEPPLLMSRRGGIKGDSLRQDIESGDWKTHRYPISFSDIDPPRAWLRVSDFAARLSASPHTQEQSQSSDSSSGTTSA